ncbi:F0F1 ATP synthase subunit A [Aceticella autotrophica]|uniref:ATP synthase subunit a n=1 Tax=Aceticella autotrophica TaxID=2755338 RepID=A0A975GAP6_9THEO|nr:F0F1 ATP synthase subunit A [Aceticella autotrophica]QSZ27297.1 F0F1 ATP synthase subunit A [Aceticella autotrophica]
MEISQPVLFTIPLFSGIPVSRTVVVTWIIMAVIILLSLISTRNWKTVPKGIQNFVEMVIDGLNSFTKTALGSHWKTFTPYLGTIAIFLIIANIIGIFGIKPPTSDLSMTAAMAVMSIIVVIIASIKAKGVKGYVKSFFKPMPVIFPMKILELFIRPLSLAARLFGNIIAAFLIMEIISKMVPIILPAVCSLYFDLFDGLLQMIIFVFLTMLYIQEAVE